MMIKKEYIKNAMECRWRLRQGNFFLILLGVMTLPFAFGGLMSGEGNVFIATFVILAVVLLPFAAYNYFHYFLILKNYECYELHEVRLDHPSTSWLYKGAVYYTVTFTANDGETVKAETKPLWTSALFSHSFDIEDYNNKSICILYDSVRDEIIVYDKFENLT